MSMMCVCVFGEVLLIYLNIVAPSVCLSFLFVFCVVVVVVFSFFLCSVFVVVLWSLCLVGTFGFTRHQKRLMKYT